MARKPQALRQWRIYLIRKKGQYLGTVEAADAAAAIEAAKDKFGIPERDWPRLSAQRVGE